MDKLGYPDWAIIFLGIASAVGILISIVLGCLWALSWWKTERLPEQVPILKAKDMAASQGWVFNSQDVLVLDFLFALQQAGVNGNLFFWGRKNQNMDILTKNKPLTMIDSSHWNDHRVDLYSFLTGNDNYSVESRALSHTVGYKDIHIHRENLYAWLKKDAPSFKGYYERAGLLK